MITDIDTEFDSVISKKNINMNIDVFDIFAKNRLSIDNDSPLTPAERGYINMINAQPKGFINKIVVHSVAELKQLIKKAIPYFGNDGNYNWIDISNLTSLTTVFKDLEEFNGDITLWDTSNIVNMNYMFMNCASFNRDISNWDVSNVKWLTGAFKNVNAEFKKLVTDKLLHANKFISACTTIMF